MSDIYFDNAATTKVNIKVADLMHDIMTKDYGNPSSLHRKGLDAEHIVDNARKLIADKISCKPDEIIFTASGSEANNLAIFGSLANIRGKGEVITSPIEHKCILECINKLQKDGYKVNFLEVDKTGTVILDSLKQLLNENTCLVSVMNINNECGTIQPVADIYNIIKSYNPKILFHTDNIQGFCKSNLTTAHCDMMSLSAHKINGPKGMGALYVKEGIRLAPVIYGGGQEKGVRGGTENVPGIAGFGKAVELFEECSQNSLLIKNHIIKRITSEIPKVIINTPDENSSPYILNFSMIGLRSEIILHSLEQRGIFVSSGSACSSNKPSPSHVLTAMGLKPEVVDSSIRLSFSAENTMEEADAFCDALLEISNINKKVRKL